MERYLIEQYLNDINKILKKINKDNLSLATQIASIPEIIRGYGHVKEENINEAEEKRKNLLDKWENKKINLEEDDSSSEKSKIIFAAE